MTINPYSFVITYLLGYKWSHFQSLSRTHRVHFVKTNTAWRLICNLHSIKSATILKEQSYFLFFLSIFSFEGWIPLISYPHRSFPLSAAPNWFPSPKPKPNPTLSIAQFDFLSSEFQPWRISSITTHSHTHRLVMLRMKKERIFNWMKMVIQDLILDGCLLSLTFWLLPCPISHLVII